MRLRVLALLLPACAILSADQVTLTNGDVLTGAIVKKDGDKLTLKSPLLGDITMPWSAVKSLKSDQELFVVLPGGESVHGKVATNGTALEVTAGTATRSAPLAAVAAVRNPAEQQAWERVQHPGFLQLWAGAFDLGLALTRGNARADTLTSTFNASRVSLHDKIILHFDQLHGTARVNGVTSTTANAIRGGWAYNRSLNPRLFISTLNDYEHDTFQSLDLRFVVGGGMGYTAIKTEKANLGLQLGGDYERENFINNQRRNSAEANFGDDFQYKFSKATSLTQTFRFYSNLSDAGVYRVNFDLSAVTALKRWLGWHVSASDRFFSNPLFGRQRNDMILSTGVRVSFAR